MNTYVAHVDPKLVAYHKTIFEGVTYTFYGSINTVQGWRVWIVNAFTGKKLRHYNYRWGGAARSMVADYNATAPKDLSEWSLPYPPTYATLERATHMGPTFVFEDPTPLEPANYQASEKELERVRGIWFGGVRCACCVR